MKKRQISFASKANKLPRFLHVSETYLSYIAGIEKAKKLMQKREKVRTQNMF